MTTQNPAAEPQAQNEFPERTFLGVRSTIEKPEQAELDGIEIVDDRPEEDQRPPRNPKAKAVEGDDLDKEMGDYSERVQKRINKLRYEQHEERRQREEAERIRDEAMRVARQLVDKNREYENIISHGEAYLIEQIKSRTSIALEQAKAKYRSAYEEGDTDKILEAQEEMIRAQTEAGEVSRQEAEFRRRRNLFAQQQQAAQQRPWQPQYQQPPQPAPVVPQVRPTEQATQWADKNPWFGSDEHRDMTALAYGVHERLVRSGVPPDSDEYFKEIDREMHMRFPDYFGGQQGTGPAASTPRRPATVVASAERTTGAVPRKVKLTATQLAVARKLGISPERYARETLLIEGKNHGERN